ncbi:MAG: zinc D-Ala-D-Ala dipeptidase [Eubacteriaceae bacterium]|jgi:D-alanyl-D-alanine dipeptidase|nr:zinc D-Ala-D-Ala dipeptidase [Eubacteriaceae bacterium]MDK2905511.1 zinc D-Ala-D-Ala dipeptidase [Eubacteriaceae bacterium]MDK2937523.1 zinc D-Ala-D-Ala dipeptidase [Eubacteriaceae bacterium]MDK2961958.1 zinc D-Ala-D-Ala dipeptidase [Eubacteriaceae bacterium]MDN5307469.1 zinc D-Ala-D-Ala dipeptidase [Eubacteriaceae bacterium]
MENVINERPEGFVDIKMMIPTCQVDLKYFGKDNFVGQNIPGYASPIALLTRDAADALVLASKRLELKGYNLKIYDGYRPVKSVKAFFDWGQQKETNLTKNDYYPDLTRQEVFEKGFIASPSAHSRGSTVDLTLIDRVTKEEIDMGGSFDFFSELSYFTCESLTEKQKKNRNLLRQTMLDAGFLPFEYEWWHFTLENEPYPDVYFDFEIR